MLWSPNKLLGQCIPLSMVFLLDDGNVFKLTDIVTDSVTYIQAPINICIFLDPLY